MSLKKTGNIPIVYFEDLNVGIQPYRPEIIVDGEEMLEYNLKYDPWPIHIDEKAAKASPYRGLIASGGYIISLAYFLSHKIYNTVESTWAFLGGIDSHLKFIKPVYAGDTLRYTLNITSKKLSRKPGRGIVNIEESLINQNDCMVFNAKSVVLVATRFHV